VERLPTLMAMITDGSVIQDWTLKGHRKYSVKIGVKRMKIVASLTPLTYRGYALQPKHRGATDKRRSAAII